MQSSSGYPIRIIWPLGERDLDPDSDGGLVKIGLVIGHTQSLPYDRLHQQEAWYSWPMPRLLHDPEELQVLELIYSKLRLIYGTNCLDGEV